MKAEDRKKQMQSIEQAFNRLGRCCESTHEWDRYLDLHAEEEKGHRRFKPEHINCGLTKGQSVKLFAVKEIFERFGMPNVCTCGYQGTCTTCPKCVKPTSKQAVFTPTAEDYFSVRHSVFAAVAMVKLCGERIRGEFKLSEMIGWLSSVDYCALNKDPRQLEEVAA